MSGQARSVLGLVLFFTAAFITVIAMRITQEWQGATVDAQRRQANAAVYLSERTGALLARVRGAAEATAAAIEIDWAEDGEARLASHLSGLQSRSDVMAAAVIRPNGAVVDSFGAEDVERFEAIIAARGDAAPVWTHAETGATPAVMIATEVRLGDGEARRVLVAQVEPNSLLPRTVQDQTLALVAENGVALASGDGPGAPEAGSFAALSAGADVDGAVALAAGNGGAIDAAPRADGQLRVLGVAPVARTGLSVYVAGPLEINQGRWRRTLVFYLLLLVAPLLVAVGLCVVLLMQMDSIRQAREALSESERRLRLAIEGARCGVWDWDLTNDRVFLTDSFARMHGRKRAETLSGADFLSLVRDDDRVAFQRAIENAPQTGEVDIEYRGEGVPVWLHARGRLWTGPDGQPSRRIVGVAIEITEQKGAQASAAAAETRLRAALESMSESFVLWDKRRRLVRANQKFRDFFQLDAKLLQPGSEYEMLELAAQGAIRSIHDGAEDGASEMELADGRWVHISERPTRDGGMVSIGTDISALKRQEAQLIENEKRLRKTVSDLRRAQERAAELARKYEQEKIRAEQASRSKSAFLANMSHELRTPLNAINGFSEIMVQEMFGELGDDHYKEYVRDILGSGQHLLELINDILDMSKIEAGKFKLALETVYPDEIAEQCARLMRGKARDAGLELVVDVEELPEIEADPRAIKQVLLNLMSNAVKFTPEGGRVEVRAHDDAGRVTFKVLDTGIGISNEDLKRIGKPFEQIENQQSKSHHGSGLGLALSKSLVEMHGGELTISSTHGKGTTVSFVIPRTATPQALDNASVAEREDA